MTSQRVKLSTHLGEFTIELETAAARETCRYFIELVQARKLDQFSIVRIANTENTEHEPNYPIEIIQLSNLLDLNGSDIKQDRVAHESTEVTGLRHKKWSVSAARFEIGYLYQSFFICLRDEPELDAGGRRNPDAAGFAVFGNVAEGFDVLQNIHNNAETSEMLTEPIVVKKIQLLTN